MHNGVKFLIFVRVVGFSRLRVQSRRCCVIEDALRGRTTARPPLVDSAQEPRERPRAAQESPRAAQDSPRASQKPTKMPRSSPRLDQRTAETLPRTWPETTHYPRLKKTSQLHHAFLQNFFPNHKAAEIKNERRRYSPQGGLQ